VGNDKIEMAHLKVASDAFLIVVVLLSSCSITGCQRACSANVQHIVICWLKASGNLEAQKKLIMVSRSFTTIPGVLNVSAGRILSSQRAIVDNTFDLAIVMTFTNTQALAAYLKHPKHRKAVKETLRPLTKKIIVYDFIDE